MASQPRDPGLQYGTVDFYFAATLLSLGMELVEVDRSDPWRARFTFHDDPRRREWTQDYFAGRLRLDPLVLFHSSRALKRAVYRDGGALDDLSVSRHHQPQSGAVVRLQTGA
jgi:Domain of unknown function (DUF5659)